MCVRVRETRHWSLPVGGFHNIVTAIFMFYVFFSLYVAHIGLMYCGDHISNYHHLSILKEICMSFHNIYNTY